MKKFTKLFLSCAAVTAVATAVGISAMAADITGEVKGTFDETAKTVTINATTSEITPDDSTQVTFLVFKGAADTDISADSVKGIDQGTTVQPANSGLKSDVVAPESGQETYTVKVGFYKGGSFTVKSGTFKLGTAAGEDIILGDVTGDGLANSLDAVKILNFDAELEAYADIAKTGDAVAVVDKTAITEGTFADNTVIGDVTGDGLANSLDAVKILNYDAELEAYADIANTAKTIKGTVTAKAAE